MAEHEKSEIVSMTAGNTSDPTVCTTTGGAIVPSYWNGSSAGVFPTIITVADPTPEPAEKAVEPAANRSAVTQARNLVGQGKVNRDSGWEIDADDENAMLGDPPDWGKYALWHLGKRPGVNPETKAAYAYPYGKTGKVYRGAVIAIKVRSAQQGHDTVKPRPARARGLKQ